MITVYKKGDGDEEFRAIDTPEKGCWIHVDEATSNDVTQIAELIGVEYTDLHDCLDRYEIPRIERLDEHILIYTRHPTQQEAGLYTTTLTLILTKSYFITICPQKSYLIETFVNQKPKISTEQTSKLLIYILLKITQDYTVKIKKIRAGVLRQERQMQRVDSKDIISLTIHEENLNQYQSSLVPLRNVLEAITSGRYTILYEKDQDLLEDLLNASLQSEEICAVNLRSIQSLRDSYQIIFTNQLNRTIKLLTALTIILSMPTMVASLYGMNVALPFEKSTFAFSGIMIFTVAISLFVAYIFHRKKWL